MRQKKTNWADLIADVQEKYLLSQAEIAKICSVAQQTVSSWKVGIRNPGFRAKRKILQLIAEKKSYKNNKGYVANGIPTWQTSEKLLAYANGDLDSVFITKFKSLSKQEQIQVIEFCDYIITKSQTKKS